MAHIHDKIDFTAEVFVVHEGKVLLRKHDKYKIWLSVGGHVELDEDPNQAALREVMEEVGLAVELFDTRAGVPNNDDEWEELVPPIAIGRHVALHPTNPDHVHVTFIYFAKSETDEVRVSDRSDKSDEWQWLTFDQLDALEMPENVREYAKRALRELSS
ncbi:MAG TPA: NUDIX domain-containing protein [Candidatus Paceibacterota bacterium]|nr:NUDIX domain-containing protein [Candidatus Paceibacterota bacterium]